MAYDDKTLAFAKFFDNLIKFSAKITGKKTPKPPVMTMEEYITAVITEKVKAASLN